jgi:hypothetical protein
MTVSTLRRLYSAPAEVAVLASILPGGSHWLAPDRDDVYCKTECPSYRSCRGSGPNGLCSDRWKDAPVSGETLETLVHILQEFDH